MAWGAEEKGQVSRAAQGCSPSSWPRNTRGAPAVEAALHSPALGLRHPLALPWDRQGLKVLACPGTSSTALSLSCRQPRLSPLGSPAGTGWGEQYHLPRDTRLAILPRHAVPAWHAWLPALPLRVVRAGLGRRGPAAPQASLSAHTDGSGAGGITHSPLVLAARGHPVGPARETRAEIKQQPRHQEPPRARSGGTANTYPRSRGARGTRQPHAALGTRQALQGKQRH